MRVSTLLNYVTITQASNCEDSYGAGKKSHKENVGVKTQLF